MFLVLRTTSRFEGQTSQQNHKFWCAPTSKRETTQIVITSFNVQTAPNVVENAAQYTESRMRGKENNDDTNCTRRRIAPCCATRPKCIPSFVYTRRCQKTLIEWRGAKKDHYGNS